MPTSLVDEERTTLRERAAGLPDLVGGEPDDDAPHYERSPAAAVRLIVSVVALGVIVALSELLPSASVGLESDLQRHARTWATSIGHFASAVATGLSVLLILGSILAASFARRPRLVATSTLAGVVTAITVLLVSMRVGVTPGALTSVEIQLAIVGAAVAMATSSFPIDEVTLARWTVVVITLSTVLGVLGSPVSLASRLAVILGAQAIGSAVALVFGSPSRRISRAELCDALDRSHLVLDDLEPLDVDARGSQPWAATSATGRRVFVKVEAVDELRAAQLFRLWRWLRFRDVHDETSAGSILQRAEHEAFVAQRAATAGVVTPTVLGIGAIGEDRGAFMAFEAIDGETLDDADELDHAELRSAWSQIQILHRSGIAHRDLRAANLMRVASGGAVAIIDFGAAEVAAPDALLERDVAEFLASSSALVGVDRAVEAAVAVLGADRVATAIPWLQPLAVTAATRDAVPRERFAELRRQVREASGTSEPELPQLQRITWKGVAVFVALGVAVWTLLPQLTSGVDWGAALEASRGWTALALVLSAVTYVGAAISMRGAVSGEVRFLPTLLAQLASSFTNRITPAKVGGAALNLRFFNQQGLDGAVAATGVGVSTVAGTVVHVVITVVVIVWAGNVGLPGVSLPPGWVLVTIGVVLVVAAAAIAVVPPLRRWWTSRVVPGMRRSWTALQDLVRSPTNLAAVLGGSAMVTMANLGAFVVSMRAFGIDESFATLGVVYLAGSALASVAPTPGGLGATEAALVAGLSVVGVGEDQAIPGVLLFRLATFWVPILPGWLSMIVLQRRGDL